MSTQVNQWLDTGANRLVDVTSPDAVVIHGTLTSGAASSIHVDIIPFAGSGYRMEIYGREGTLVLEGDDSPQLGKIFLRGARGVNVLEPISAPEKLTLPADRLEPIEAINVGRMYTSFARAIHGDPVLHPTFETALELHRIIDGVRQASSEEKRVAVSS